MEIYSPLQQIQFEMPSGIELYIKRDDLIHPYISGNKWRKLKYLIQTAQLKNKKTLVTFGGAYSNHLLATACAAALKGFKSVGFVRGEELDASNHTLFLCEQFGMKIIFVDRISYLNKPALFEKYFSNTNDAFFIDEGGRSDEAILGCSELIDELPQTFDHIVLAAGTGSTFCGILKGCAIHNLSTKVHAVVVHKGIQEIVDYTIAKTTYAHYSIQDNYHFGAYAKTSPDLISFMKKFQQATGILLDPVYTAKALYALYDLIQQGVIQAKEKVLFIHTGGLIGNLGMKDKLH
jgi:1-aminocyclopropane-1-carboxylate deaminase